MNLNDLDTFLVVAELGTFSRAAQRLNVPKSTVSRRVARLEASLGVALLVRSARSFALSDDGRALYDRCAPAMRDIADVARDLVDSTASPRGRLRVTSSIDFGTTTYLAELVTAYGCRYPDVHVALESTNRMVDLMEEGLDIGFRTHVAPLASRDDLMARRLGAVTFGLFASETYLADAGVPADRAALGGHRIVSHGAATVAGQPDDPDLTADDYRPVAALLAAGAGIGVLPDFVAAPHTAQGTLVRVLPDLSLPAATLSLVWLRSRHLAPRVRAFIDLAVARYAS
jgi:DNA-binding transcriptional LysR family regulator